MVEVGAFGITLGGGLSTALGLVIAYVVYSHLKTPVLKIEEGDEGAFRQDTISGGEERWKQVGVIVENTTEDFKGIIRESTGNCKGILSIKNLDGGDDIFNTRMWRRGEAPMIGNVPADKQEKEEDEKWLNKHGLPDTAKDRGYPPAKNGVFINRRGDGLKIKEKELCWDFPKTPVTANINKDDKNRLFVARLRYCDKREDFDENSLNFDMIDIPSGYGWDNLHVILQPNKTYECTLLVTSSTGENCAISFYLNGKIGEISGIKALTMEEYRGKY